MAIELDFLAADIFAPVIDDGLTDAVLRRKRAGTGAGRNIVTSAFRHATYPHGPWSPDSEWDKNAHINLNVVV